MLTRKNWRRLPRGGALMGKLIPSEGWKRKESELGLNALWAKA